MYGGIRRNAVHVVAFVWLLSVASQGQIRLQAVLQQGNALLQQGHYDDARREFLVATHEYPGSPEAFALLGVVEIQLHNYAAAETALRNALARDPHSVDALYNLGVLSLEQKRPKQAAAYFEKAGRFGSPSPELALNLIRAQLECGENRAALMEIENARMSFKDRPDFHLQLGKVLLAHNMPTESAASLRKADLLAPSQPEILLPLVEACLQLRDLSCARAALAGAGTHSEGSAEFHFLKGRIALLDHQREEGFHELEAAIEREPRNPQYLVTLAKYHQKYGQQESAIEEFQRASKLAPDLAEIQYGLAVSYFIQDDFSGALDFSTKALKLNPAFDRALFLQAISHFAKNHLSEADQLLTKALKLQPRNAFYRCFQGMVRLSMDRFPEAEASFREAVRLQPSYALARYQLGRTLVRMKNYSDARPELERAVALQPDLGEAYYQLGLTYRHIGEEQKAADAMSAFRQFKTNEESVRAEILRQAQQGIQAQP